MNDPTALRWQQRFNSYHKALSQLTRFIEKGELNELEEQGLIQAFEYTHELAWKLLKDYLNYQGEQNLYGSKDVTRLAFNRELIDDGQAWMDMIKDRNLTSHTYNPDTASAIAFDIRKRFFPKFVALAQTMKTLLSSNAHDL